VTRRLRWLVCALVLAPVPAWAQVIAGAAAWSVGSGSSASDGQPSQNNSFWQDYTLGYTGSLVDARLLKYNAELAFRTNSLNADGVDYAQQGHQRDVGYKLGASLFPARPFPFFIQASGSPARRCRTSGRATRCSAPDGNSARRTCRASTSATGRAIRS
jgi:hypothetical protein